MTAIDWLSGATCAQADPDAWTPDKPRNYTTARRICLGCDVLAECRAWITEYESGMGVSARDGMWAAMTPHERWEADPLTRRRGEAA